jgi:hypothetical protein
MILVFGIGGKRKIGKFLLSLIENFRRSGLCNIATAGVDHG